MNTIEKILIIVVVGLFLFSGKTTGQAKKDVRPNIVFFIADDMTRDMFNFLPEGKEKNLTPNLDRLAHEGTILMGQHVSATVCTPSRFNVLTGKYASRANNPGFLNQTKKNEGQRAVEWNTHILPGEANMALLLKANGYFTGAVGKNHVIEVEGWKDVPLTADWKDDKVKKRQRANYDKTVKAYLECGFDYAGGIFYENPDFNGPRALAVHNLDWTTQAAMEFLDRTGEDPFFLYFATTLPHGPQKAERAWNADRTITPIGKLDEAPDVLPHQSTIPKRLKEAGIKVRDPKANLLWMDDAIGAVLHKLEELEKLENTIIVFFNDHGQFAKGSIYQGATENPSLIWKKGGFKVGQKCETLVSNVDFVPTILELAGLENRKYQFDGISYAQVLNGEKEQARESLYFEIGYTRGVRMGDYKYMVLRYPDWVHQMSDSKRRQILDEYNQKLAIRGKGPNNLDHLAPFGHVQIIPGGGDAEFPATQRYPHYAEADQLYHLKNDPNESRNLFNDPAYVKVVEVMQQELMKYVQDIPGKFGEFKK
jgi:arylsulfatase A-like enzyme